MAETMTARPAAARYVRYALIAVGGSLCLAVSAKIAVPFRPVPMTMQSLTVVLLGVALGPRLAMAAVLTYLAEGAAGIPVFASPLAGLPVLFGPTAGYLFGFVPAAGLTGWLARRGWGRGWRLAATLMAAHAVLFVPGVAWLAQGAGWERAIAVGLTPFIAGTLVKCALGVALVEAVRLKRRV